MNGKKILKNHILTLTQVTHTRAPAYDLSQCPVSSESIQCSVCKGILFQPLQLGCGALVCSRCLCNWIQKAVSEKVPCPCCKEQEFMEPPHIKRAPVAVQELLSSLPVTCEHCNRQTKECDYRSHIASRCTEHHLQVPVTFQQVASQSLESPVQSEELQAAGNILRRYRHAKANSPEENLITVPCSKQGGKVHCTCICTCTCTCTQKVSLVAQLVEGVGFKSCLNSVVSRMYMCVHHTHSLSQ